jgi:hypothetical protein
MAVSPLNLTIELTKSSDCTTIYLTDVTGVVGTDGNTDGYDISGGPAHDDVTSLTIVVTYNNFPTTLTYVFTLVNHAVTDCTLAIASGTPANIFAELDPSNLVFPFEASNPFSLFADYGVDIPTFTDDIYTVSYTIEGEVSAEAFSFTTEESLAILCAYQLCVNQKFAEIDWNCECASKKSQQALLGQAYINQVGASVALGDLSVGLSALGKLALLCQVSDGGCGCS